LVTNSEVGMMGMTCTLIAKVAKSLILQVGGGRSGGLFESYVPTLA